MFAASIPDIFLHNQFLPISYFWLYCLAGCIFLYTVTAEPVPDINFSNSENLYRYLKSAWLGQEMLWRVFWPFFILVHLIFFYIDYRIVKISFTIASWKTVHGMLLLPLIWWLISLWQCSMYTGRKLYSIAAGTAAVYLLGLFGLRLYMCYEFAQQLFDCRLLILEYGDC